MDKEHIRIGGTCFFYGTGKDGRVIKKAIITGPWNTEFPEYIGVEVIPERFFCYVRAAGLFVSVRELKSDSRRVSQNT